jgi:hypothetical protein
MILMQKPPALVASRSVFMPRRLLTRGEGKDYKGAEVGLSGAAVCVRMPVSAFYGSGVAVVSMAIESREDSPSLRNNGG